MGDRCSVARRVLGRRTMSRANRCLLYAALGAALALAAPPAANASSLARRWSAPSRLMPRQAAEILRLEATGEPVAAESLFEAEKLLRSDGPVSPSDYVLTALYERLLKDELGPPGDGGERRVLPPVLHWMAPTILPDAIELEGESVQLALEKTGHGGFLLMVRHRTIHQVWSECGAGLCVRSVETPRPAEARYEWSVTPGATIFPCETAAAATLRRAARETVGESYRVACAEPGPAQPASLRFRYARGDAVSTAPRRASASAVVNNPTRVVLSR
jgi:hypothetical protein